MQEAHRQTQSQHRAKQKHRRQRAVMQKLLTRTIARHAQQEMQQVRQMMSRLTTKPALMEWQKTLADGTVIEIPVLYVPRGHKKPKHITPLKN